MKPYFIIPGIFYNNTGLKNAVEGGGEFHEENRSHIGESAQGKGLGQKELASLLNLSIGTISNYENGVHSPDLDTLCRLADFFDVTSDYLLGRTEYRCPPEILGRYVALDYTAQDIVNAVLELDQGTQAAIVDFVKYMQHIHGNA